MVKPRILVAGATGKTGSVVVTEMLNAGYPVRALVHRNDERSAYVRREASDATWSKGTASEENRR